MNKRSLSALAAAVTLSLAAAAGAQSTSSDDTRQRSTMQSSQNDRSSSTATSAQTAQASKQKAKPFQSVDKDGDGYLSRAELPQDSRLGNVFTTYDANEDGRLARDEYETWMALEGSMGTSTAGVGRSASQGSNAGMSGKQSSKQAGSSGIASTDRNNASTSSTGRSSAAIGSSDRTATTGTTAGTGDERATAAKGQQRRQADTIAFSDVDRDGDGYLREADINTQPTLAGNFEALDRNGDDRVSRSEYSAWQATLSGNQQRALTQQEEEVPELQREREQ